MSPIPVPRVAVPTMDHRAQNTVATATNSIAKTQSTAKTASANMGKVTQIASVSVEGTSKTTTVRSDQVSGKKEVKDPTGPSIRTSVISTPSLSLIHI